MKLSINVDISKVKSAFRRLGRNLSSRPLLTAVGSEALPNAVDERWNRGQRDYVPLKPTTIERRVQEGYGTGPILVNTGDLLRSYTVGEQGNIFAIEGDTLTYGSKVEYAIKHQLGMPQNNLPARPLIDIDLVEEHVEGMTEEYVDDITRRFR